MRAVLVLGKELRHHPERAARELRARAAAAAVAVRLGAERVMTLEARLKGQPRSGSELVREHLAAFGVPEGRVLLRSRSHSTREEVVLAHALARELGVSELWAVTHDYHLARTDRMLSELPLAHRTLAPTALWRWARPAEREAIQAAVPDAGTWSQERWPERTLGALGALLSPLPARVRWGVEVRAGRRLRLHGDG